MKKATIFVVSGLILMVAFAYLIYPTPYKYLNYTHSDGTSVPMKMNIITGKTEAFTTMNGWFEVENSE